MKYICWIVPVILGLAIGCLFVLELLSILDYIQYVPSYLASVLTDVNFLGGLMFIHFSTLLIVGGNKNADSHRNCNCRN